jgi:hypothetical protein
MMGRFGLRSVKSFSIYVQGTLADHTPPKNLFREDREGALYWDVNGR